MSNGFGAKAGARRCSTARPKHSIGACLCLALTLAACGQAPSSKSEVATQDPEQPDIGQAHFALLSTTCTVTTAGLTIAVDAGETAILSLSNELATVNANQADGSPCQVAPTKTITVNAGTAGDHSVFLDLSGGLFSKATAANTPKIKLSLGTGTSDSLSVRGTSDVDHFYFGKGTTAGTYLLNFNGGTGVGDDAFPDVTITGAEQVIVNGAAGNDILDATGLFGTVAPYPEALSLYGGANDDQLTGGAGDDTLSGDAGNDQLNGGKGANKYTSGTASDGTDVITVTATATDTADYSQRFNAVSVLLDNSATSGETNEHDSIPDTVSTVIGGNGNDSLSAASSTRRHTLFGGPGNDTLTGGLAGDTLEGGNGVIEVDGDDVFIGSKATASYSSRTQPITVTVNAAGSGGADANDGDQAGTRHAQFAVHSAAGATITASTNTVTGLQNMNAGSVGRLLVITGSTGGNDNGSYHIASVTNATTVVLNSSDTAAKVSWANDSAAGWSFTEDAGAEKDEVRCPNVLGSSSAMNTLTGDVNSNILAGGAIADTLVGGAGYDTLNGADGNDTLYGGADEDTLIGGIGTDVLYGGDGNDILEGDEGDDSFTCDGKNDASTNGSAPGRTDYLVDYKPSVDNDTQQPGHGCEY